MAEVDKLTGSVILTGRLQRNIIAPVFILTFVFIMLWVSHRINLLNKKMTDFSQQTLGAQKKELQKGDQLIILEKRFQLLTKEILEAREMLKKQAEEKTRLIVNSAFDAIITIDTNNIITTWNPQAEATFGWTHEQAVGQSAFDIIIAPGYRESLKKGLKNFLDTGEEPLFNKQIQINALHRDGHELPVECAISPAQSGGGYFFVAIIRDITERKRFEEELISHRIHLRELVKERTEELTETNEQLQQEIIKHKQAEERKTQLLEEVESVNQELKDFAYIVSHDLKAPLRALSGLATWLSDDYKDKFDEEGKENLNLMVNRANRMSALINGILEYSKVGRIKEEKVILDMNEIVAEVIELIAPPENVIITVENELPSVVFERTRITEVFQNLVGNAVEYLDKPQGIIKIGCVDDNGFWKFHVSDNGPGIEDKYYEKIFQIFQTLSSHDEHESTGIGLTLVKKIITLYGGKIWVESEPGKGSTFYFTVPRGTSEHSEREDIKL
jgi:PAS domain S-box-containing protein